MIGSFIGATLGYTDLLVSKVGIELYKAILALETVAIAIIYFMLLTMIVRFIKDNKRMLNGDVS